MRLRSLKCTSLLVKSRPSPVGAPLSLRSLDCSAQTGRSLAEYARKGRRASLISRPNTGGLNHDYQRSLPLLDRARRVHR